MIEYIIFLLAWATVGFTLGFMVGGSVRKYHVACVERSLQIENEKVGGSE